LGENVINLCKPKVAQNVVNALGYFIFSKTHNQLQKVAQTAKNSKAWSPCFSQKLNDLDEKKVFEILESKKKKKICYFSCKRFFRFIASSAVNNFKTIDNFKIKYIVRPLSTPQAKEGDVYAKTATTL